MADLTVWYNPDCSKCRTVHGLLAEQGVDADYVRYLDDAPSRTDLERVLALLGTDDPRAITRTGERLYAELGLDGADRSTLLDALAAHPVLLERPIAIRGDRAVVARPPERILELLSSPDPESLPSS
jgi:arsenate reductase